MTQYLYRTTLPNGKRPSQLNEADLEIVREHFAHLQELTKQRVVILVGRTQDDDETTFGLCIFEADSDDAARAIMEDDPAIAKGAMLGELHPFAIALQRE